MSLSPVIDSVRSETSVAEVFCHDYCLEQEGLSKKSGPAAKKSELVKRLMDENSKIIVR